MTDTTPKYFVAPSLKPNGEIVWDRTFVTHDEAMAACQKFEEDVSNYRARMERDTGSFDTGTPSSAPPKTPW